MEASQEVLRTTLEYSIRLTGAERGFVFLGESAESLRVECGRDQQGNEIVGEPAISRSVVQDAAWSQDDFILTDITDDVAAERQSLLANANSQCGCDPSAGAGLALAAWSSLS